jgi:O-acetyl-ADP-ribose deacetylase (regulator of RNase III)
MIRHLRGNLLHSDTRTIAHGCNTEGRMGAGVAKQIRSRYPAMFEDYQARCRRGEFSLGDAYLFRYPDGRGIINLATQGAGGAEIRALENAFSAMGHLCEREDIGHVAIPRIGAGLGRLRWEVVEPILRRAFDDSDILVDVYTLDDPRTLEAER